MKISRFFFSSRNKATRIQLQNISSPLLPPTIGQEVGTRKSQRGDAHIALMSEDKKDKIGGKSILDKQWNEKPMQIIKSPHKLTEVELYSTLQKIVEMPEKRLRQMIVEGGKNNIDEVFLLNLAQRVP
jgi:hypothetical protein